MCYYAVINMPINVAFLFYLQKKPKQEKKKEHKKQCWPLDSDIYCANFILDDNLFLTSCDNMWVYLSDLDIQLPTHVQEVMSWT